MWKWCKNLLILLGTVVVLVGIAFFPKIIAFVQDREILSQAQLEEMQSVQLNIQEELPALGKLALMKNVHKGNCIEISREDASMSAEEVQNTVSKTLQTYYDSGLIPLFEKDSCEYRPLLIWDSENSFSGIVWEWILASTKKKYHDVKVFLDDETGEILLIQYTGNNVFENSVQEKVLSTFCEIYFESLQIMDYEYFVTDDLEYQYIGENVQGVRYRFGDAVYGEVNVDFFVHRHGFYLEFPDLYIENEEVDFEN